MARSEIRLRAFGIEPGTLQDVLDLIDVSMLPSLGGQLTVLVGAFGAGKSEAADTWLRRSIRRFEADEAGQVPLWLHAREIVSQSVQAAVGSRIGEAALLACGVAMAIDGLDEVGGQIAARAVEEALAFVRTYEKCMVVVTCRPGVVGESSQQMQISGLERESARQLVERVAGHEGATWSWNSALLDSLRSPFFAIAAGVLLASGQRAVGQAELMRRLVEQALASHTAATRAVDSLELHDLLVRMAVALIESDATDDGLSFAERQRALTTTLVNEMSDGSISFSLPIFGQWFAAEAILADLELVDRAVASAEAFDAWRWAVAVAGMSASPAQLDDMLGRAVRGNPGAGAWLVSSLANGHERFATGPGPALDPVESRRRLLIATRSWIDGLGGFAPLVFPWIRQASDPIHLGATVEGRRLHTGWSMEPPAEDRIEELPSGVRALSRDLHPWRWTRSGPVGEGAEWPWLLRRDEIASAVIRILRDEPILGPRHGVWHRESEYRAALLIARQDSWRFDPIPSATIRAAAEPLLERVRADGLDPTHTYVDAPRGRIRLDILADLIESLGAGEVIRPVPAPDLDPFHGTMSYPLAFYSDQQLSSFYAEVLGLACVAYEEATDTVLAAFDWTLGTQASRPFGVVADLAVNESQWGDMRGHVVTQAFVPLSVVGELLAAETAGLTVSANGRAVVRFSDPRDSFSSQWIEDLMRRRVETDLGWTRGPFRHWGTSGSIEDRTRLVRPVSANVADWLWSDLGALDLTRGVHPRLD